MKSLPLSQIQRLAQAWHTTHKTIVLATGVFDLLHAAHQEFLKRAQLVGDLLIVGVESDERVKILKGSNRPIQTQAVRIAALARLPWVDYVFPLSPEFNSPQAYEQLIQDLRPQILAISSHSPYQDKKKQLLEKYGGRVQVVMEQDPTISTTQIIQNKPH